MTQEDIADELELYAELLRLDGQDGRAIAREKAARTVRMSSHLPPDPARLNGVGNALREDILAIRRDSEIPEFEELRDEYSWYLDLGQVNHIGPERATKIHEKLHIDTLEELDMAIAEGDLTLVSGIGPATQEKIRESVEQLRKD